MESRSVDDLRIAVTCGLPPQVLGRGLGERVLYRPALMHEPAFDQALRALLVDSRPIAALVHGRVPDMSTLDAWMQAVGRPVLLVHAGDGPALPQMDLANLAIRQVSGEPARFDTCVRALRCAERHLMDAACAEQLAACGVGAAAGAGPARVALVGAGIVNLMTALALVDDGFGHGFGHGVGRGVGHGVGPGVGTDIDIDIYEASPDPRQHPAWIALGCTHGGDNARMFGLTEADCYNDRDSALHVGMDMALRRPITEGGWLTVPASALDEVEHAWIRSFERVPAWRAEVFARDIYGFNAAGGVLWERLRRAYPQLFADVGLVPGVLRIYTEADALERARALHEGIGALRGVWAGHALARRHPALAPAVAQGVIAGALEVVGFTLNIHDFCRALLGHLESRGVRFHWGQRVHALARTGDGRIRGLALADRVVHADHYVLSLGAHGERLLAGTRSAGKMQGICGLWLRLPEREPRLAHSLKIHGEGCVGEDANVILARDDEGRPILIYGSGYAFLGHRPLDMASPELARLFEAVAERARRLFPARFDEARRMGTLTGTLHDEGRACVRPMTATGLGIFELLPAAEGGRAVITGGNNTGGFTQAPIVAEAVRETLAGRHHGMQVLFDPERGVAR